MIAEKDKFCLNCGYSELYKVPLTNCSVEVKPQRGGQPFLCLDESEHWALCLCKNKNAYHYNHFLSLRHTCGRHDADYHCQRDEFLIRE